MRPQISKKLSVEQAHNEFSAQSFYSGCGGGTRRSPRRKCVVMLVYGIWHKVGLLQFLPIA
jgi:hypothetical protein